MFYPMVRPPAAWRGGAQALGAGLPTGVHALALFETMGVDATGAARSLRKLAKRRPAPG